MTFIVRLHECCNCCIGNNVLLTVRNCAFSILAFIDSFHCPMITTLSIFSETNYAPLDWNNNGGGSQELENEGGHNIQLLHFQDIHFKYLTTLSTWGGTLKWNFLHQFGTQLTVLKLVHVEEITLESMRNILANTCPQLAKLELQNCALNDNSISSRNRKDKNEKSVPIKEKKKWSKQR